MARNFLISSLAWRENWMGGKWDLCGWLLMSDVVAYVCVCVCICAYVHLRNIRSMDEWMADCHWYIEFIHLSQPFAQCLSAKRNHPRLHMAQPYYFPINISKCGVHAACCINKTWSIERKRWMGAPEATRRKGLRQCNFSEEICKIYFAKKWKRIRKQF